MHIRHAQPRDAAAMAHVSVVTWQSAYRGVMPDALLDGLSIAQQQDRWAARLEADHPPLQHLVAEGSGGVVGFASVGPARGFPSEGELYAINVQPDQIGTGVGRALLAAAMQALRQQGFSTAILWVLTANRRARRFYEAGGWQTDGTARPRDFGGAPLMENLYRCTLSPEED